MTCHNCSSLCKKFGKFGPKKIQRYRCKQCKRTFSEEQPKPLGRMLISMDKAEIVLSLLVEGNSIRSISRITGIHQRTILELLVLAGEKCERIMHERIKAVAVRDVEADEIWGFVKFKNRHKLHKEITDSQGGRCLHLGRD